MISPAIYKEYVAELLKGNKRTCSDMVKQLLDEGTEIEDIYFGLFHRSMYEVGRLWEQNEISVATEHLATAITEMLLSQVYPLIFRGERKDRSIVISCGVNELHQLGAKMVADYCEFLGWDTHFLGANTPMDALIELVAEKQPNVLGLSVSITSHLKGFTETTEKIKHSFPQLPVIAGGRAFAEASACNLISEDDVTVIDGFDQLQKHLGSLSCVTA